MASLARVIPLIDHFSDVSMIDEFATVSGSKASIHFPQKPLVVVH